MFIGVCPASSRRGSATSRTSPTATAPAHAAAMEIASGSTKTSFSDRKEFFCQISRAPRSPPLGERQAESSRIGLLAFPGTKKRSSPPGTKLSSRVARSPTTSIVCGTPRGRAA